MNCTNSHFYILQYFTQNYDGVDLSDCPALREFGVQSTEDNYEDCDYYDDDGEPVNCEGDEPEIIPEPPNDYEDSPSPEDEPSTSNNILSPTSATHSSDNIDVKTTDTQSPSNGEHSETLIMDNEGSCYQAKYILIAMTSVILSFLCN